MDGEGLDLETIKKRSVAGVIALTLRTFFLQLVSFMATFLLTVFLTPKEFGVFFVISSVVNFLGYFSDIGLAAALIQKKEKINEADLKTTFTIQQGVVISLVVLALFLSNPLASFYKLTPAGLWLFRVLIFSLILSSLKTIPSIILERRLEFNKLIIPQIVETIFFYSTAVFLAWKGFGVTSFTIAVLIRGFSGLIVIYLLAPWRPALGIVKTSAKRLLSFGLPFQLNSFLALLKDNLLTAYLGKILPMGEVGFVAWAQKWAFFPLRFFMDSIIKITFPAYSRLQHNPSALSYAVEKSLYALSLTIFPTLVGLSLTAPYFVNLVPKYSKWQPALLSLSLFCFHGAFSSISTTLTNLLSATGNIKTVLKLMIFWTVLTWILTPIFIFYFGFNGVALAAALIGITSLLTVYLAKKVVSFRVLPNIAKPAIATFVMGIILIRMGPNLVNNLPSLGILIILGGIIYLSAMLFLDKERLLGEIKIVAKCIKK